ncbi:50S ribosomal protein L22 [Candidatus Woesearchaeota archaeon]|nr:MAG: 50S ribosomal protein L22 [Candidatus Woesearchaeota archaeon]
MVYHYTAKADPETMAKAVGRDLPISTKQSIEICAQIRGKSLQFAKRYLQEVVEFKRAVPFRRFNRDVGHKKTGGPGRYPVKACTYLLKLLNSVEANAQNKGLSSEDLVIETLVAHKGSGNWHYGRHRRRKMKNTTVEVIVRQKGGKAEEKKNEKPVKSEARKEEKKEKPKEEAKTRKEEGASKQKVSEDKTETKDQSSEESKNQSEKQDGNDKK